MFENKHNGKRDLGIIIGLALLAAVGISLNVVAAAVPNQWWPLLVFVCYLFAPIPNIMCGMCHHGDIWGEGNRSWKDAGFFLTGLFVVSGFGVPAVLWHAEAIKPYAFFLSVGGGILLYGSVLLYVHVFVPKHDQSI